MVLWGSLVNAITIIIGTLLGATVKFPNKIKQTVMHALGLTITIIGISMGLKTANVLIPVTALVLGGIIGEILKIEARVESFGETLHRYTKRKDSHGGAGDFAQGFLAATLLFCVGAMAIIGGLDSGLHGDHQVLYAKSMLDGVLSIFFYTTFGVGVAFSALPVFLYQGGIALLAKSFAPILGPAILQEITATGGIILLGIGLNTIGLTKIAVGNMLPAVVIAGLLAHLF